MVDEIKAGWRDLQPRTARPDTEAIIKRKVAQMQEAGVQLVFGSDEGSTGELPRHATWMDADLWVRVLGMEPMAVLRSMTSGAARTMGVDAQVGTVTVGKVRRHRRGRRRSLRHINVLRDPKVVIKAGRRYK